MDPDPTQDTLPTPAVRPAPASRLGRFVRSVPGAFLIIAVSLIVVLALAAAAGYNAGSSDRDRAAATAQAKELDKQYQLGLDDLSAGRPGLAVQRFEFILSVSPNYPGASQKLAEARATLPPGVSTEAGATQLPTPTLIITVGPDTTRQLFEAAQSAFKDKKWDDALQKIGALRVIDQNYEREAVRTMQFQALQFRAIAYIDGGKLELGLADLDQASKMGALTEEAQQRQQWAEIYIAGVSYWGLNWARTVDTFALLYKIAPYFRDTSTRLHDAQLAYARQLDAQGQPCDAVTHYTEALKLQPDQAVSDKLAAAQNTCQNGTPTPNGSETATPGTPPPPSPTPGATATEGQAPTSTTAPTTANTSAPAATVAASPTATSGATATVSPTTAATTPAPTDTTTPTQTPSNTPAAAIFITFNV